MEDKFVTLAHGAGGQQTNELIDRVFKAHFANPQFTGDDAAVLEPWQGKIAFSTDGFIVSPWEFPGGNMVQLVRGIRTHLAVLDPHTEVFSGHGPSTSIGEELLNNPYIA